jgi:hypothetical protein
MATEPKLQPQEVSPRRYHSERSFSVTRLSQFPPLDDDAHTDFDDNVESGSVFLPSDDSGSEGADSELWAAEGLARPGARHLLNAPAARDDADLAHVCVGVDVGTVVHEVSFILLAPRHGSEGARDAGVAAGLADEDEFVPSKFGFHMHASLCVERQDAVSAQRIGGAGGGSDARRWARTVPLSSRDSMQRGRLVKLDSVFSVNFGDDEDGGDSDGDTRAAATRRRASGQPGGGGGGLSGPNELFMLPFNKRAVLEHARTGFPADNPVRLWMAAYSHHEPRDAFVRAMQELARVAREYLIKYAPGSLQAKGAGAWAQALQSGFTCDALCYALPLAFLTRADACTVLLQALDGGFEERVKFKHSLFQPALVVDLYAAIVYYAVNLKRSKGLLGNQPQNVGLLLDIGHGFTSAAAFVLVNDDDNDDDDDDDDDVGGGAKTGSKEPAKMRKDKDITILHEHSTDVGYSDIVHAVMQLVVVRFESIYQTPPQLWQYLAMFEVCRAELKEWAADLRRQIEAYSRRHRVNSRDGGGESRGVSLDVEPFETAPGLGESADYWAQPQSWRKSARRNLNYHISSSRLIRFKSSWADFSLNLTGKDLFRVSKPHFKRMLGVCSRTFRHANFSTLGGPPALLFASNSYAEVPIFHELVNLKLKKLLKTYMRTTATAAAGGGGAAFGGAGQSPTILSSQRLAKICLGCSCVAQGAAICATILRDRSAAGASAGASSLSSSVPSGSSRSSGSGIAAGAGEVGARRRASPRPAFRTLLPRAHHFQGWSDAVFKLVERTRQHVQQNDPSAKVAAAASTTTTTTTATASLGVTTHGLGNAADDYDDDDDMFTAAIMPEAWAPAKVSPSALRMPPRGSAVGQEALPDATDEGDERTPPSVDSEEDLPTLVTTTTITAASGRPPPKVRFARSQRNGECRRAGLEWRRRGDGAGC